MLKMTVVIDNTVAMEQVDRDSVIARFFPKPENVLSSIEKQGWYGLASYNEKDGITVFYKVRRVDA